MYRLSVLHHVLSLIRWEQCGMFHVFSLVQLVGCNVMFSNCLCNLIYRDLIKQHGEIRWKTRLFCFVLFVCYFLFYTSTYCSLQTYLAETLSLNMLDHLKVFISTRWRHKCSLYKTWGIVIPACLVPLHKFHETSILTLQVRHKIVDRFSEKECLIRVALPGANGGGGWHWMGVGGCEWGLGGSVDGWVKVE